MKKNNLKFIIICLCASIVASVGYGLTFIDEDAFLRYTLSVLPFFIIAAFTFSDIFLGLKNKNRQKIIFSLISSIAAILIYLIDVENRKASFTTEFPVYFFSGIVAVYLALSMVAVVFRSVFSAMNGRTS